MLCFLVTLSDWTSTLVYRLEICLWLRHRETLLTPLINWIQTLSCNCVLICAVVYISKNAVKGCIFKEHLCFNLLISFPFQLNLDSWPLLVQTLGENMAIFILITSHSRKRISQIVGLGIHSKYGLGDVGEPSMSRSKQELGGEHQTQGQNGKCVSLCRGRNTWKIPQSSKNGNLE